MAYKPICTPCFQPGFHIARHKQASYPGGLNGVQYANARLSGLLIHRSHRCIEMACNALQYIFAALLDAPRKPLDLHGSSQPLPCHLAMTVDAESDRSSRLLGWRPPSLSWVIRFAPRS